MGEDNKEVTFEEMMDSLDVCVKKLESDEISLEDSFHVYEQGMRLIKECNEKIDRVEKKVLVFDEEGTMQEMQ